MDEIPASEITVAKHRLQVRGRKISSRFNALPFERGPDLVTALPAKIAVQQYRIGEPAHASSAWRTPKATDVFIRIERRCVPAGQGIAMM